MSLPPRKAHPVSLRPRKVHPYASPCSETAISPIPSPNLPKTEDASAKLPACNSSIRRWLLRPASRDLDAWALAEPAAVIEDTVRRLLGDTKIGNGVRMKVWWVLALAGTGPPTRFGTAAQHDVMVWSSSSYRGCVYFGARCRAIVRTASRANVLRRHVGLGLTLRVDLTSCPRRCRHGEESGRGRR